jgi:hypothetical protein
MGYGSLLALRSNAPLSSGIRKRGTWRLHVVMVAIDPKHQRRQSDVSPVFLHHVYLFPIEVAVAVAHAMLTYKYILPS